MTSYLRKSPETIVFRVALKEERDIFDDPVLKSPSVSRVDIGLSHLFNEETSDGRDP